MINIISNNKFVNRELVMFTKKVGYKLPDDYIDFLKKYNGGDVKNSFGMYYKNGKKKFILTLMFGLGVKSDEDLMRQFEIYINRIPTTCIPVGRDAGGNLICLHLSEDKYGYVYFWDHEEELEHEEDKMTINDLYFIADSFEKFLNSIKEDVLDKTEAIGYEVKKVWIDPDFLRDLENSEDK